MEATCIICGKALTDPLSISLSIGPVCRLNQKHKRAEDKQMNIFGEHHADYDYQDVKSLTPYYNEIKNS